MTQKDQPPAKLQREDESQQQPSFARIAARGRHSICGGPSPASVLRTAPAAHTAPAIRGGNARGRGWTGGRGSGPKPPRTTPQDALHDAFQESPRPLAQFGCMWLSEVFQRVLGVKSSS
jgi:hypothetical protein